METQETIKVDKTVIHRYCDECGEELHWDLQCSRAVCQSCGKMLCSKCIAHERDSGDWGRGVYCKECCDIFGKYKQKLELLKQRLDNTYAVIKYECEEARKQYVSPKKVQ